ncbi:MAG: fused MFS/spermidine synthase [Gemmataceae bacterium]
MMPPIPREPINAAPGRRFLPLLIALFAGSGFCALVYEIVWLQLLQLVIGSGAVSLGVLLGTFMGGMCLGSYALPRLISAQHHPLRIYAALEVTIGILGIVILFGIPYIDRFYLAIIGYGLPGFLLRGAVCSLCLLPPTVLMGATLPAVARWIESTPQGVSWLGLFYGGNIAGAVLGCLVAGFYLLRVHDMATAIFVAAIFNGTVALISLGLSFLKSYTLSDSQSAPIGFVPDRGSWPVYVAIALSGSCALAAEVIWTRLLSLLLGATVYTFSIILAVFLVGLGIGSSIGSVLARQATRPRLALGSCQLLLVAAIAWTAFIVTRSLPYWPINPYLSKGPWYDFQLDLVRCSWAIFPATCLWGASFPLALAAAAKPGQDPGRLVGGIYAANTIGAIVGAIASSVILIGWIGTQDAQRLLIGLSALAALLMFIPQPAASTASIFLSQTAKSTRRIKLASFFVAVASLALLFCWSIPEVPWQVIAFGRGLPLNNGLWRNLYVGEGMNSSVAVTEVDNVRNFHVSGKVEASTQAEDMRLQRMLGLLPALIHAKPRSVLIVGCGAGVTAGSFVVHPDIERIVICEIEPLVPRVVAEYFAKENNDVVHDPRVEIVYDDARHFILTTAEKFDIITSDPIHPWVKGSATLYTKEYFELCQRHLNPGGVITQWVPLYESSLEVVKSEIATFFEAFPGGTIWSNDKSGEGYDIVLLGQLEATRIDVDDLQERLKRPDHQALVKALKDVGFESTVGLFATYAGQARDLAPWLENSEINRDRNLRLQYLAGMWLNIDESKFIYECMLYYRRFPEGLFVGSGVYSIGLKWALTHRRANH